MSVVAICSMPWLDCRHRRVPPPDNGESRHVRRLKPQGARRAGNRHERSDCDTVCRDRLRAVRPVVSTSARRAATRPEPTSHISGDLDDDGAAVLGEVIEGHVRTGRRFLRLHSAACARWATRRSVVIARAHEQLLAARGHDDPDRRRRADRGPRCGSPRRRARCCCCRPTRRRSAETISDGSEPVRTSSSAIIRSLTLLLLRRVHHHVEGLAGRDPVALHQDAHRLTDDLAALAARAAGSLSRSSADSARLTCAA